MFSTASHRAHLNLFLTFVKLQSHWRQAVGSYFKHLIRMVRAIRLKGWSFITSLYLPTKKIDTN